MKKVLITGILGQDGAYLAELLLKKGYKVYGLIRRYTNPNYENLEYLGITKNVNFIIGDLTDQSSLVNAVKTAEPDEVYNLAAQPFVGSSWDLADYTTEVNAMGTLRLLEVMRQHCSEAKFYQAATSEMFGNSSNDGVQTEETSFHPRSPYAISKLYAYWITNNFKESYGMFCTNGILFNHESPIRGVEFVTRKITIGVARIAHGLETEIRLGNIDSKRDWGFAGDYVEAMYLMMQQEEPENYLISTGETHSVREILDLAFSHIGIDDWESYVKIDPQFIRPAELFTLQGKSNTAQEKLGWKPKVRFKELITMMVDADMKRVSRLIEK